MTVYRRRYEPTDPRLGRHIVHDSRSLDYAHHVLPTSALKAVQWQRRVPIFDQGEVGSCTGNALAGAMGTDSEGRIATAEIQFRADDLGIFQGGTYQLDEDTALGLYALNTREDDADGQYPPDDTGSSSLAAGKSGRILGVFDNYTHAFSLQAMQTALQTGPALIGIPWYQSMFTPNADGSLDVDPDSGTAGGHELCVSGWDKTTFRVDNSWAASWGDNGSCYVTNDQMQQLLADGGDCLAPRFVIR